TRTEYCGDREEERVARRLLSRISHETPRGNRAARPRNPGDQRQRLRGSVDERVPPIHLLEFESLSSDPVGPSQKQTEHDQRGRDEPEGTQAGIDEVLK